MSRFEYAAPASLEEVWNVYDRYGEGVTPLGGGTDLLVQIRERGRPVRMLMSLRKLDALKGHSSRDGSLRIGASATAFEVARSQIVKKLAPALADGAELIGSIQVMNRATVAGNICNAAPSADTGPALVVSGAEVVVIGPEGERRVAAIDFIQGPGKTALRPGEIVREIIIPALAKNAGASYIRHTPRKEMDIAVVGVGAYIRLDAAGQNVEDARVALGAVAPTWRRSKRAEAALKGEALDSIDWREVGAGAAADASPIDDMRGSASFRRELLEAYAPRAVRIAIARAQAERGQRT